jgi:signal transduction histidine kinase
MHQVAQERAAADLERIRNVELHEALQTLEKQRELVIEESRQKTQFLSVSAHDLRNMTGGILSGIEILRDGLHVNAVNTDSDIAELLDHMSVSAEELHQTMMQLMDAGSIEAKDFNLEKSEVDLVGLVKAQINQWRTRAQEKGQTLELLICDDCSAVLDLGRFRSVISNLLSNAIKYTPENGRISVSLQAAADEICLTVEDSGPGFAGEDLKMLGRPFQRLSAKPTGGEISVGLGLYIVRHSVEMHGGELIVENLAEGGASICIRLAG